MSDMAAETRLVGGGLASLPRVNLLPPEIAERAQLRKIQGGLAGVVVLAVAAMGFLYVGATDSVGTAQDRVEAASAEQRTLQAQKADLANVTAVFQQAATAQALLTQAMGSEIRFSRFLSDMSLSMPDNVWIVNAAYTQTGAVAAAQAAPVAAAAPGTTAQTPASTTPAGTAAAAAPAVGAVGAVGTLVVSGVAYNHNDVATWLESLAKSAGLESPTLQASTRGLIGTRSVVTWSTTVNLSAKALSGRYTTPAGG
jgi:Tfp pilus assembly protein PilN